MKEASQLKLAAAGLAAALLQTYTVAATAAGQEADAGFAGHAAAALPLLLAAYGATMSDADRTLLTAIRAIDQLGAQETGKSPLASAGYVQEHSICVSM